MPLENGRTILLIDPYDEDIEMFFLKHVLMIFIVLISISFSAIAMPPLEEKAIAIRKDYWNKNMIHVSCGKKKPPICDLNAVTNNRPRKIKLDFSRYNLVPNLEQVGIIPTSESGNEFYFYVGVDCSDRDIEIIPESINSAECVARFKTVDGKVVEIPQVQIYPITTQDLHREVPVHSTAP